MKNSHNEIGIVGTGFYVPEKIMTNYDLEKIVDTTDEWIRTRTGIEERRIANVEEATSDLATKAGLKALQNTNIPPEEIDLLIIATHFPDYHFPSTSCITQNKLGLTNAVCFDLSAACSGSIYSLFVAESMLKNSNYNTAMIIGSEIFSRTVDWEDRDTCVLFGDGAGAIIIKKDQIGKKIISFNFGSDGSGADLLKIPAGGSKLPTSIKTLEQKQHFIKMEGKKVYKFAKKMMVDSVIQALDEVDLTRKDIDLLIPHQANIRILKAVAKKLHLPIEKIMINLEKYGNTSAASIPIALDEAISQGKINKGDIVVLTAFGAGLTWGAIVIRW
ncbi:MAG: beta-ketoacyl-ACP synthase III [Candidatus Cloacimonadales bacterium]|nr:beta-ketoacyl-ACP synthase III [Candidatus Cloacimonadales bacterium]